jgi:hypothetical protein
MNKKMIKKAAKIVKQKMKPKMKKMAKKAVKKVMRKRVAKNKIEKVMHEFKEGALHSGSKKGPQVKSKKQAIAIALSEARRAKKNKK